MLGLDAVPAGCRVRDASSFAGGAGAGTSSAAASIPSGPRGPMESSRLSRVVDCARLPCRRIVRDFEGAGLAPVLEAGEEGSCVGFEEDDCSALSLSNLLHALKLFQGYCTYRETVYLLPHLLPWLSYGLNAIVKGHLQRSLISPYPSLAQTSMDIPSHGDPPSSIALHGLVLVSILPVIFSKL